MGYFRCFCQKNAPKTPFEKFVRNIFVLPQSFFLLTYPVKGGEKVRSVCLFGRFSLQTVAARFSGLKPRRSFPAY
jgi:hypothetical protein